MSRNIETIVGSLLWAAGAALTIIGAIGHEEIDYQDYAQQALVYGGVLLGFIGATVTGLGAHKWDSKNKDNQDNYAA